MKLRTMRLGAPFLAVLPFALAVGCDQAEAALDRVDVSLHYEFEMKAEEFDPKTATFKPLPAAPTKRLLFQPSISGGKVYFIGGTDEKAKVLGTTEAFDPQTNTWSTLQSWPRPRIKESIAVDNTICVFGGSRDSGETTRSADVDCLDTAKGEWSQRKPLPQGEYTVTPVAAGGKFYTLGGDNKESEISDSYSYDPSTDVWTKLAAMPVACLPRSTVALEGIVYVLGCQGAAYPTSFLAYDIAKNSWSSLPQMPTRDWGLVGTIGGEVAMAFAMRPDAYLGSGGIDTQATLFRFNPKTAEWKSSSPAERLTPTQYTPFFAGNSLYVVNYADAGPTQNGAVWKYDGQADTWTKIGSHPTDARTALFYPVIVNDRFLMFGEWVKIQANGQLK